MSVMARQLKRQPEVTPSPVRDRPQALLIDRSLPRYDFVVAHAGVFRAPPETCYRAARDLDLLQDPVVRTLLGMRALPQRIAGRVGGDRDAAAPGAPSRTFRLDDMVSSELGWILLGEEPDVQIVLGQIGRPWKPVGASEGPAVAPTAFASFDGPGYAKIAFSLGVQPYGATSSLLTMETRVAMTDPESLRRFTRYWMVVAPLIRLIDRMTLRLLARELRESGSLELPRGHSE
jgi:hypothetical protein